MGWYESSGLRRSLTLSSELPKDLRKAALQIHLNTQNRVTVTAPPFWWVVWGPTKTQDVKTAWKAGYRLLFFLSLWESLTLRYPPAETSILVSGEKQRSVTQPPWVVAPSSTEIGAHKWRSSPFETFHIYKSDTQFISRVTQKFYIYHIWNIFGNFS